MSNFMYEKYFRCLETYEDEKTRFLFPLQM